ncbi:MAG: L,D-transpeptidase [Pseudaminobacter sp.]|nr:L,D-transpeptidase [Pseudaminobacter sp.]
MKRLVFLLTAAALGVAAAPTAANDRYRELPPVVVSPDLSAPWLMQLGHAPGKLLSRKARRHAAPEVGPARRSLRHAPPDQMRTAAVAVPAELETARAMNPIYLPQTVAYDGPHAAGTIIIDTRENFLFLVGSGGEARRYGVGTGKPGFEWAGTHTITQKRVWPDWRPPSEMISRERAKGRHLPVHMAGGPENPLGARAMYLGSTLYRIHGTNQPSTIGGAVSSGCIRMRNEDVVDLYERVDVGTKVVVM